MSLQSLSLRYRPCALHAITTGALVAMLLLPLGSHAADITVVVSSVQAKQGRVTVGLFDSPKSFPNTPIQRVESVASAHDAQGQLRLVLSGVAPGRYALAAYHDLNGDGQLNTNWVSRPTEPYGFSNQARGIFGPPAFDGAAVLVGEQDMSLPIELR